MSRKKTNGITQINPGSENEISYRITMDINTKMDHSGFIQYRLGQMPPIYKFIVGRTATGYRLIIDFPKNGDTNRFFVAKYIAGMAGEIRMLDESNYHIELLVGETISTVNAEE